MNVKLGLLGAGVLFFLGQGLDAQSRANDTIPQKSTELEEVVVMGYVKRKVSNTTGSSQQMSADKIENPTQANPEFALQGNIAGVQATAPSGTPGAQQAIRVRGVGTFTANARPLYVIDGIPVIDDDMSADNSNPGVTSSAYSSLSPLATIPSQDIESITVLKDASATAAYGARGSNGVIVINTKRGRGGKARFSLSANYGFQNDAFNKVTMLTGAERLMLLQEGIVNQKIGGVTTMDGALALIKANNFGNYNGWMANGGQNNDWAAAIRKKNSPTQEYAFSVAGGANKINYYFSLNNNQTEATVIGTEFKRIAANLKLDAQLTDRLKMQSSVLVSKVDQDPLLEGGSYFGNPFLTRYLMTPWYSPYDTAGNPNIVDIAKYTSIYNTLYTTRNDPRNNRLLRMFGNLRAEYKLTSDLTLANNFAIDYNFSDYKSFNNRFHGGGVGVGGSSYRQHTQNVNFVNQLSLNWVKRLGELHRFDILGLFEYQKNQRNLLSGGGEDIPIDGLFNIASAGKNFTASSSYDDFQNAAFLGMLNYSLANRLVVDATFRREGSSRFAPGKRYGNFWSVGVGYNLIEDVFKDYFDILKIRGSYGLTGNSGVGNNEYQNILAFDTAYRDNLGSYPRNYGSPDLTWEKNRTYDIGLDYGFWNRRVSGSIAYFNKLTIDLLQNVPLSRTTGFNEVRRNVGEMENRGWEFSLSVDVLKSDKFNWNIYGNFATLDNEIVKLAKDEFGNDLKLFPGSVYTGAEVGESFRYWNLKKWAGVDPATGNPLWYVNGVDGETTSNWTTAGQANQGRSIPKFTGGFGTRIDMGSVFLNALFTFQGGHKVYEEFAQFYMRTNSFVTRTYNGSSDLLNRWQKPGDVTNVPKMNYSLNDNFHAASTRWLHDGDFIRLRNLQVGYKIPREYLTEMNLTGVTLTLTGSNLYTWVKDKNLKLDPETGASSFLGLTTPPVKTIMFGTTINF